MEREDDINIWKQKFTDAEIAPSEQVWHNIAGTLDNKEVGKLRRRIFYFRWSSAVAACLILAIGVRAYWYVKEQEKLNRDLLNRLTILQGENKNGEDSSMRDGNKPFQQNKEIELAESSPLGFAASKNEKINSTTIDNSQISNNLYAIVSRTSEKSSKPFLPTFIRKDVFSSTNFVHRSIIDNSSSNLLSEKSVAYSQTAKLLPEVEKDLIEKGKLDESDLQLKLNGLSEETENKKEKSKKSNDEEFWTVVGVSAGSFNNITPTNSGYSAKAFSSSVAGQTASDESNSPGYIYAINIGIGAKISKRWVFQGGVSYLNQVSEYTANSVLANESILQVASVNELNKNISNDETNILASTPYSVTHTIESISFPLQAGFIVFENKWAMQINSGLATDLFLQSTQTPNAKNVEASSTGRGSDSPYRDINFAGLLGSEISYRFGNNYRISVAPGLRYPLQSIYKDKVAVKSTPLAFDVALRFRYIFN